ncbi:MAG: CotH kinase family protein [Prolixibacteraceae bacterium]|nr:CotH kinase family protein [Prolixibacteraceae bacterium]
MKIHHLKISILIIVVFSLQSCFEEMPYAPGLEDSSALFFINNKPVFEDSKDGFMLLPVEKYGPFKGNITLNKAQELYINNIKVKNNSEYNFKNIDHHKSFTITLVKNSGDKKSYDLFFTLLPVVKIEHSLDKIYSEPKYPAKFILVLACGKIWDECCGIETRGGSSSVVPKKSYGIEIWEDFSSEKNKNISVLDMYIDDDWILDAVYRDSSRVRNRVSFDVWSKIQADALKKGYDTQYSAIKGEYVELFLNDGYHGLYCFSERVEAKMLNIKIEQTGQQGYLYKSESWSDATRFISLPDLGVDDQGHWSGWEQKYPKTAGGYDWGPLYDFTDFAVNSSDEEFCKEIANRLVLDQAIDFLIFVNIVHGGDNVGKNIFLSTTSDKEPFYILPWDLDATWGRNWLGEKIGPGPFIKFELYNRIFNNNPEHFRKRLKLRYAELRKDVLSTDALQNHFQSYIDLLNKSGAVKRDNNRWPEAKTNIQREMVYLSNWIHGHGEYLDNYFRNID